MGGIEKSNVFTKITLAVFGQITAGFLRFSDARSTDGAVATGLASASLRVTPAVELNDR